MLATDIRKLPRTVEEIDTAWLKSVLPGVKSSSVVQVIHGTATKVCLDVEFEPPHQPSVQRMWAKTGLEPHSMDHGMDQVYAGETLFYQQLSTKYETRSPKCFYAGTDADGISVVLLEDVVLQGAKFKTIQDAGSPDYVGRALEAIARRQAASWMAPELHANEWLRMGGSHRASDVAGWVYAPANWEKYSKAPRFQTLPAYMRDRAKLEQAYRNLQDILWPSAPWSLAQGDCHYGQSYEMPDGEVRFLDWSAVLIAHWCHDVAYFMTGALSVTDRRACERDLLEHYLGKLAEFGVKQPPAMDEAWAQYSTSVIQGVSWVMCPVEMQPEENCITMAERFATAADDLGSMKLALAL